MTSPVSSSKAPITTLKLGSDASEGTQSSGKTESMAPPHDNLGVMLTLVHASNRENAKGGIKHAQKIMAKLFEEAEQMRELIKQADIELLGLQEDLEKAQSKLSGYKESTGDKIVSVISFGGKGGAKKKRKLQKKFQNLKADVERKQAEIQEKMAELNKTKKKLEKRLDQVEAELNRQKDSSKDNDNNSSSASEISRMSWNAAK